MASVDQTTEERLEQFVDDAIRTEPSPIDYTKALIRINNPDTIRLLHAAMGMCTEAGEFIDALKKHIFYGKALDHINLIEEVGDMTWYERIAMRVLKATYFHALSRNVAKLKTRFPDKFTEANAINRDLDKERIVLSGKCPMCRDMPDAGTGDVPARCPACYRMVRQTLAGVPFKDSPRG